MSDLLKEAIADAKAVRETALQNAKMALEEAFTPQLKSMLSAKLKEEDLEEDSTPVVEEEEAEDEEEEEVEESTETPEDTVVEVEDGEEEGDEEEVDEGSYHENDMDDEDDEDDLDLEAVIRELESELSEVDSEDGEEVFEAEESVEEPVEESEEEFEIDENELKEEEDEDDEEVEESVSSEDSSELSNVQNELKEYKEAVHFLKDKLHEVNILNAKLLFTNKLFKEYVLDNGQKLKVVETFDRAQTTREIKLVYSTLAEQFGDNNTINRKSIKESASAPVASTKPSKESTKVISEESEVANRFKKLAGLING